MQDTTLNLDPNTTTLAPKGMFKFQGNPNNPLGLFEKDSKVYQVLGFFNYLDNREFNCDMRGDLPWSYYADRIQQEGFEQYFSHHISINAIGSCPHNEKFPTLQQLNHFKLDPSEICYYHCNLNISYVFKIHRKPISIQTVITGSQDQAIWDYILANDFVPQIMSENNLAKQIANAASHQPERKSQGFDIINSDTFKKTISHSFTKESIKTKAFKSSMREKNVEKEKEEAIKNEPAFELLSDYENFQNEFNVDLFELRKKIITQAKRKGGFVDFNYKGKTYQIPKLPLLCWAIRDCKNKSKYTIHNDTWYAISPDELKTSDDNPFHSDWWIGAGFPIESYGLNYFGTGWRFNPFNEALEEFAFNLIGKGTLDNVVVIAGKEFEDISGEIVLYPHSIDSFKEDDIIILPKGSVEYDSFIKKACANGKGAVIVEVMNAVSHLTIVSREMNALGSKLRLIALPNASKLLRAGSIIEVSCKNETIKNLT